MRSRRHAQNSAVLLASVSAASAWSQSNASGGGGIFTAFVAVDDVDYSYSNTGAIALTTADITLSIAQGQFRIVDGLIYVAMNTPVSVTLADGTQGVVSVEQLAFVNGALDTSALVFDPQSPILTLAATGTMAATGSGGLFWLWMTGSGSTGNSSDNAPAFSSGTTASMAENSTATGYTAAASDADGDTVSYSLGSSNDEALFAIDSSTGVLSFQSAPDYEAPGDANTDNDYVVEVIASDGTSNTSRTVTVSVTDVVAVHPTISTFRGIDYRDEAGFSISTAGDINNDGYDDALIGAWEADPYGQSGAGEIYVIYGQANDLDRTTELSALDGSNGFVINGVTAGDTSGWAVRTAGDFNDDGIDDFLINSNSGGVSYMIFGNGSGFGASLDLSSLNGTNGFAINVGTDGRKAVSYAGDMNNDGVDDIIIGDNPNNQAHVIYGHTGPFAATFDVNTLDGSNGFTFTGASAGIHTGYAVSTAGDINNDSYDDLVISAWKADPNGNADSGSTYVVFGTASGFGATFDLSSLNGSNGFVINGEYAGSHSGHNIASLGDLNNDGFDDIGITALWADPNGINDAGQAYVVFGKASGFDATLNTEDLNGRNGFRINGLDTSASLGGTIDGGFDVNGDGLDDMFVSASNIDSARGHSYVIFGTNDAFNADFDLTTLDGTNGFVIYGGATGDRSLRGYAGDINNDGFDDIIVGGDRMHGSGNFDTGGAFIVYGQAEFDQIVYGNFGL